MPRASILLIPLLVLVSVIITAPIEAEVPSTMNYQGYLTGNSGEPVPDTTHNLTFRIYDEAGTVLWEESHIITTTDGLFTVQLGSNGSPLTAGVFEYAERQLGITVDTDPEIAPRTQLNTVPYAFRASGVRSQDIVNEPGVAAFSGDYYVYLDDLTYTVLASRTIVCPAEGYVMAIAHGRIATLPQHTFGTDSYATVGISDYSTSLPGNQDLDFHIDAAAPSGVYSVPFGMTGMFRITSAGSYTYYYLAYEYSGSVTVADMQFNLVYFPTAYGTVDPVPPPAESAILPSDLRQLKSDVERHETEVSNVAQLKHELDAMKARIEAMQLQIDDSRVGVVR